MDEIDKIGYFIWNEYYTQLENKLGCLPKQRGSNYWQNKYYSTFRRIAEKCLAHNVDGVDFIATAFTQVQKDYKYLTPKDFDNNNLFNTYKQTGSAVGEEWVIQVNQLTDLAQRMIPEYYKTITDILLDTKLTFDAWFRVMYEEPFKEEVFTFFGQTAWSEIRKNITLRNFLCKIRLSNIKELEKRLGFIGAMP